MPKFTKTLIAAAWLSVSLQAYAAERELIYTYAGVIGGAGFNRITYNDWFYVYSGTKKISGHYFSGGAVLYLVSKYLIGDIGIQYMYNRNDSTLQHLFFTVSGKFGYTFAELFTIATGPGMYLEAPVSGGKFKGGAGVRVPLAFMFNTNFDSRIFIEGSFMYGWYGMGEKSTKMSYGLNLGFIYKVGRI